MNVLRTLKGHVKGSPYCRRGFEAFAFSLKASRSACRIFLSSSGSKATAEAS